VVNLLSGPAWNEKDRRLAPHLVINPPEHCALSQRETFGPILVLRTYSSVDSAIAYIRERPRPLAFYPFTNDGRQLARLLEQVISGGVTVNHTIFHVAQTDLPFGGVGASGIGSYHGHDGFLTCSKLRPIFRQSRWLDSSPVLSPPYGRVFKWIYAYLRMITRT
jgi:coniferyl-aldehyde dehydrogenase